MNKNFKSVDFSKQSFRDVEHEDCIFEGCNFTEAAFWNADFKEVDLAGTLFHQCDLARADFSSAMHYQIDPQTNNVKKAKFSLPEAVGLLTSFDIDIT